MFICACISPFCPSYSKRSLTSFTNKMPNTCSVVIKENCAIKKNNTVQKEVLKELWILQELILLAIQSVNISFSPVGFDATENILLIFTTFLSWLCAPLKHSIFFLEYNAGVLVVLKTRHTDVPKMAHQLSEWSLRCASVVQWPCPLTSKEKQSESQSHNWFW